MLGSFLSQIPHIHQLAFITKHTQGYLHLPPQRCCVMARAKTRNRPPKGLVTWTRFHLPREQEWPTWSVGHADVHVGPLAGVEGWRTPLLARMVEDPEQAVYIIGKRLLH